MKNKQAGEEKGFTLMEILIVVVIIGFLASTVGPDLFHRVSDARHNTVKNQLEIFSLALDDYRLDNERYPTTEQGLEALVERPTSPPEPGEWNGPYLDSTELPLDPWGNEYQYRNPGIHNEHSYDLWSLGPEDMEGGESEERKIGNW